VDVVHLSLLSGLLRPARQVPEVHGKKGKGLREELHVLTGRAMAGHAHGSGSPNPFERISEGDGDLLEELDRSGLIPPRLRDVTCNGAP